MNIANQGFLLLVGVYNRTTETTHEFISGLGAVLRELLNREHRPHQGLRYSRSLRQNKPRSLDGVMIMVKAGSPVDAVN